VQLAAALFLHMSRVLPFHSEPLTTQRLEIDAQWHLPAVSVIVRSDEMHRPSLRSRFPPPFESSETQPVDTRSDCTLFRRLKVPESERRHKGTRSLFLTSPLRKRVWGGIRGEIASQEEGIKANKAITNADRMLVVHEGKGGRMRMLQLVEFSQSYRRLSCAPEAVNERVP
jgi:hypothetical protein